MSTLLPKLTEAQVKALILGQSFGRGQSYYRDHAISDPVQRGNVLEARCEGSLPNPYRVRVTFGAEKVLSTDCTCPVGSGCKHVAALLLTWVHHPDWFVERESVETMLDKRSKNELIILIKEMIKREPNLETLLDLPLPGTKTRRTRVDPEPYRRRVRNAFIGADEWEDNFAIASELSAVNDLADQFLEAEEWGNAQIVYQAVVEEGLANYENAMHDEGDVMSEIDRAAEGLAACLPAFESDYVVRQALFRTLFEVIKWDTNMGGYGAGDEIPEMLFEHATLEERQFLREWIMEEARAADFAEGYTRKWRKDHWAGLLLQLDDQEGDVEGFLARARSLGMYRVLFGKLVEIRRIPEAVEVAYLHLRDSEMEFLTSAETLESAGFGQEAFQVVNRDATQIKDIRLLAWLAAKYEAKGDLHGALNLQLRKWDQTPSLEDYQTLERLARPLQQWDTLRPRLLAGLDAGNNSLVLARIYLYEQNWDAAWEVAERKPTGPYAYGWLGTNVREEVARATEQYRPQRAIGYYLWKADELIKQRSRDRYAEAAGYLQRVKRLSGDTGQMDAWANTIRAIRENNKKLPALQDELKKAGL